MRRFIVGEVPAPPSPPPSGLHPLVKYFLIIVSAVATVFALYVGKSLFILLFTAGIISFLLLPICRRLEKWRFPTWAAAIVCCVVLLVAVFGVIILMGWQYAQFGEDLPALNVMLNEKLASAQAYFADRTHVSQPEQTEWIYKQLSSLGAKGGSIAMAFFSTTGAAFATIILIPIFVFFLLLRKTQFRLFFEQLSPGKDDTVLKVVTEISVLSRKWLKGVLTVMLILAVLNSIGFMALGLKYAILLGVTAAMFNVIPYIGPWIGAVLPIIIALLTKDSMMYVVGAMGVILLTQFIDNNFITPKVVGSSVSINPLASIVALLAGGMIWGLMGLILAIPITGMLKLVFDKIPGLQPWGFLLGEERSWPEETRIKVPFSWKKAKQPTDTVGNDTSDTDKTS